jgi:hypothetical protein
MRINSKISATMRDFSVNFDSGPFESLDQLALLSCQDYNLGNAGDWFGEFRGGLFGFYSRIHGVKRHYAEVHEWLPRLRTPTETEYHLASIFFQMDSAIECLTFALNALGWASEPTGFRNVTDAVALKDVAPRDVFGDPTRPKPIAPKQSGYAVIFPSLQALWHSQGRLIAQIRDLHDVSKHRKTIYVGGQGQLDAPAGFYESLGIPAESNNQDHSTLRTLLSPAAEIILKPDPKIPSHARPTPSVRPSDLLEDLVPSFAVFVSNSGSAALADAQTNVPLKIKQFPGGIAPAVRPMDY